MWRNDWLRLFTASSVSVKDFFQGIDIERAPLHFTLEMTLHNRAPCVLTHSRLQPHSDPPDLPRSYPDKAEGPRHGTSLVTGPNIVQLDISLL
jgi:hypothetical protein